MPITTREYLDTLREAVLTGKECSMLITGNSMQPFLQHGRDTIYFRAPSRPLKRGDMVFFRRPGCCGKIPPAIISSATTRQRSKAR